MMLITTDLCTATSRVSPKPNKTGASTPYDFAGKNLTPCGGALRVITMRERCEPLRGQGLVFSWMGSGGIL